MSFVIAGETSRGARHAMKAVTIAAAMAALTLGAGCVDDRNQPSNQTTGTDSALPVWLGIVTSYWTSRSPEGRSLGSAGRARLPTSTATLVIALPFRSGPTPDRLQQGGSGWANDTFRV